MVAGAFGPGPGAVAVARSTVRARVPALARVPAPARGGGPGRAPAGGGDCASPRSHAGTGRAPARRADRVGPRSVPRAHPRTAGGRGPVAPGGTAGPGGRRAGGGAARRCARSGRPAPGGCARTDRRRGAGPRRRRSARVRRSATLRRPGRVRRRAPRSAAWRYAAAGPPRPPRTARTPGHGGAPAPVAALAPRLPDDGHPTPWAPMARQCGHPVKRRDGCGSRRLESPRGGGRGGVASARRSGRGELPPASDRRAHRRQNVGPTGVKT